MGQGTTTTLAAALGDELYLDIDRVGIALAPFGPAYRDPVFRWMFTGNSQGISSFYDVMRRAGAAAREMLIAAAGAKRLNVAPDRLSLRDGAVWLDGARSFSFGDLVQDAAALPIPTDPAVRADAPSSGRSMPRWDVPAKVDGSARFGIDVMLPGMVVAAVRCAPRLGGELAHYDTAALKSKPGVIAVVEVPNGWAVVADTYLAGAPGARRRAACVEERRQRAHHRRRSASRLSG